jgi:internalin A
MFGYYDAIKRALDKKLDESIQNKEKSFHLHGIGLSKIPEKLLKIEGLQRVVIDKQYYDNEEMDIIGDMFGIANHISDWSPLLSLHDLRIIDSTGESSIDEDTLEKMPYLEELYISGTVKRIDFLKKLPKLKKLAIIGKSNITDWSFLSYFENLELLDLSGESFCDASFLNGLSNLKYLNISGNNLSNIEHLKKLTSLEYLNIGSNKIKNIEVVCDLPSINTLILRNNPIEYLSPLSHLKSLVKLDLTNLPYEKLALENGKHKKQTSFIDLSEIQDIVTLKELYVGYTKSVNIESIGNLHKLKRLDIAYTKTESISFIDSLDNLEYLDISSNKISDISPLASLKYLDNINASDNKISNLSPLCDLKLLWDLNFTENLIEYFPKEILINNSELERILLVSNPIKNIPLSIIKSGGKFSFKGCLPQMKDYFLSLENGYYTNKEHKVLVVGNGWVGKTSLIKKIIANAPPSKVSTHGIDIFSWQTDFSESSLVHFWDFAGQDIYHATHQLFMRNGAVFILVYDKETEESSHKEVDGISYENFRINYWLDQFKSLSKESPILIVQNKIDEHKKDAEPQFENYNIKGFYTVSCELSSQNGIESLKEGIDNVIRDLPEFHQEIPLEWYNVKIKVDELMRNGINAIEYEEYLQICQECGVLDTTSTNDKTLLDYLDHVGVVYYDELLFDNRIIINQQWALNAVYKFLNRNKEYLEFLNQQGRFSEKLVDKIWSDYKKEDRKTFLSYMVSCYLCFKIGHSTNSCYVIPQMLSVTPPQNLIKSWSLRDAFFYKMKFEYIHQGVFGRFIASMCNSIRAENYWKNGIEIWFKKSLALITYEDKDRAIIIQAVGEDIGELIRSIQWRMGYRVNTQDKTEYISVNGLEWVSTQSVLKGLEGHDSHLVTEDGKAVDATGYYESYNIIDNKYESSNKENTIENGTSMNDKLDLLLRNDSKILNKVEQMGENQETMFLDLVDTMYDIAENSDKKIDGLNIEEIKRNISNQSAIEGKIKASFPLFEMLGIFKLEAEMSVDVEKLTKKAMKKLKEYKQHSDDRKPEY